ncbi:MAG: bifunctional riboflavin kinase/FAD synthetase [Nodosilinea sp.]
MWITSSLATAITPTAIALGNFDGVHLGHQDVINRVLPAAPPLGVTAAQTELPTHPDRWESNLQGFSHRREASSNPGSDSCDSGSQGQAPFTATPMPTVMTFFPHPQEFFSGQARPLLTPLTEKATQISRLGIGQLVLLPFNQSLARLSPADFVETLLIRQLQVRRISVGKDFCFGQNRQGTVEDLKTLARRHGVDVCVVPLACLGTERISSSRIRAALQTADLTTAEALLGRPYSLTGRVVQGQQLGRTLGFPTANLSLPPEKFLPRHGVYSVWVSGVTAAPAWMPGVMNIGVRPTVNGLALTVEVHLLDWAGDLYGKTLEVRLHRYLRPEQKFASVDDLKTQIQQDCRTAEAALATVPVASFGGVGAS